MKAMNILIICLVVVFDGLFLFNEKSSAQEGMVLGEIGIMKTFNQQTKNNEIIVYHKPSNSFLVYGYSDTTKKGLQLLNIRRLEHDFIFAEKIEDRLDYKKDGYDAKEMKRRGSKSVKP